MRKSISEKSDKDSEEFFEIGEAFRSGKNAKPSSTWRPEGIASDRGSGGERRRGKKNEKVEAEGQTWKAGESRRKRVSDATGCRRARHHDTSAIAARRPKYQFVRLTKLILTCEVMAN